ncbi:hypothetical protein BJ742DRAFT_813206 [Cladochytrium replicatum]|nr:hypothetical protein BJ742DRAFT_813206 [Cladochytrium replicatum]
MVNWSLYASKRVLFTGCATGLGSFTAKKIASNIGASGHMLLVDFNAPKLEELQQECLKLGNHTKNITSIALDLTGTQNAHLAVQTAVERMGGIDMVFINHMSPNNGEGFITFLQDDIVARSFQLNVTSVIALITAALPYLYKSGTDRVDPSRIVYTSSFSTQVRSPFVSIYGSCKSAMVYFLSSLRQEMELARRAAKRSKPAVKFTIIHFGSIDTAQYRRLETDSPAFMTTKGQPIASEEEAGMYLAEKGLNGKFIEVGPHSLTPLLRFMQFLSRLAPGFAAWITLNFAAVKDGHYDALIGRLNKASEP